MESAVRTTGTSGDVRFRAAFRDIADIKRADAGVLIYEATADSRGPIQAGSGLASQLLHELVELDLRLRPFQSARVPHDLLVGVGVAIGLDRGVRIPFRIGDEFGSVPAAQELFRHAALLPDHERSAFRLPDPRGLFDLGRIDLDVDEADDRHWRPPGLIVITVEKESIDAPEQRRPVAIASSRSGRGSTRCRVQPRNRRQVSVRYNLWSNCNVPQETLVAGHAYAGHSDHAAGRVFIAGYVGATATE